MSSDEDDYMSDKFLAGSSKESDVRPGLVMRTQDKRVFEQHKKKLDNVQPKLAVHQQTQLEAGLKTAISDSNKGFQMLAKMGYKPGTSLGKSNEGIIEPINVIVKKDNAGLGVSKMKAVAGSKRKSDEELKYIERNFKQAVHDKTKFRELKKYFLKAQVSCEYLDRKEGMDEPLEIYYWPEDYIKKRKSKEDEESSSSDEEIDYEAFITNENLNNVTKYLREKYFYCIYCVSKGSNEADLNSFCPGSSMDVHDMD